MNKPFKYFINYNPKQDSYHIKKSNSYSINDWGYYSLNGALYSPKADIVFDSLEEAKNSLKTSKEVK